MRRIIVLSVMAAFCLLTLVSAVAGAQAVPAEGSDYRDVLNKANQQLLKIKSYHMTMELTGYISIDGKEASFVAGGEADAQVKPMLMKNVTTVAVEMAGARHEMTVTQYMEEGGDKFSVYTQTGGKWGRMVMANPTSVANHDAAMRKSLDLFAKAVSGVTPVRETDEALFLEVAVNLGSLLEGLGEVALPEGGKKLAIPPNIIESLKELKDLVYTVEIDKKTMLYSSVAFDLSAFIGSIGEKIIEVMQIPPDKKAAILETLNSLKIEGSIAFSRYNAIAPIIIPPEAKNAPLLAPKPPDKPGATPPAKPEAAPPAKQPTPEAPGVPPAKSGTNP